MKRVAIAALLTLTVAALVSLGVWQVQRRAWKHDLVAQVDRRLAAPPIDAPGPAAWRRIGPADVYTRIIVHGILRADRQTFVQAVTGYGPGFWVMAPVETDRGFTLLVNRGFVPQDLRRTARRPVPVTISGLLRLSEPGGGFLRTNDPAADRWYSRDVAAIAARRSLGVVAPYFIDGDARPGESWPKGGLTIVTFPDNHLLYAITWFTMATLLAGTGLRMAWRRRRR
ncbi:SURF1 family protein [Sphingomonas sp. BIUV-7]|uniref:SURF1-like protein n=1 Tax=Sphingomonas natans TaxID=3063330 RepID=A0ABT8YBB0_9SPHN|nr:SURF1 family protein [Sphingomonas sp. BIUV-7]MDO6414930.1 SURF1 family protein [Sphingomonas sp. BIUV-7]